ncbi:AraC family transcriptional regulator [Actinoplanes sp. NPDC051851]|uniref:helix-turn-helix transcriptional regulator n=1 Tax=Actinoplanes sp. NPDC051851 TaxID=3154753 RepID=UPI00342CBB23
MPEAPLIRAWRPPVDGVVEVLHAHFGDHAYPMHAHDAWTVLLVDDGAVRYDLDRHEHGAFHGQVTILPPHVPHNGTAANASGFRKRVLYLESSQLPARLVGASVDNPAVVDRALQQLVSAVHRLARTPGDEPAADAPLALALERLRARLGDHPGAPPPSGGVARDLRDLLEANVVSGVPLRTAAAELHFAPAHLVRAFGRAFGMSPHQYLISRRVDLARRLILAGEPLPAVAVQSGFYDQPHLVRHFKRILGVSPGVYARSRP